jgi:hypothetical protein
LFEDYNPPPVELLAEQNQAAQQAEADTFVSQSAVALKQYAPPLISHRVKVIPHSPLDMNGDTGLMYYHQCWIH